MSVSNFPGGDACMGYAIIAMRKHRFSLKMVRRVISAMSWEFDSFSVQEAENILKSWMEGKKDCNKDCLNCEYEDCIIPEALFRPTRYKPRTQKQKDAKNAREREYYHQHKANGICVRCGRQPAFNGKILCYECGIKEVKRQRLRSQRKHMKNYYPDKCCMCDNPVKSGFKVCESHWKHMVEISQKGTATMQRKREQERIQHILEKYSLIDEMGNVVFL